MSLPLDRKALRNKWVYKLKDEGGGRKWFLERLVFKGYAQQQGIGFKEIFSQIVKMTTIRIILGLVVTWDLKLEQLDVKTTFLHYDINEELFMHQPEGFIKKG